MRESFVIAIALIMLSIRTVASAAAPATSTTSAASVDFSTPKAAATTLFNAIVRGDREVVAQSLFAADDKQRALADAMADLIIAGRRLGDAARTKFGAAGDPIGRGMLDPSDVSKIEQASVDDKGDTATLTIPGQLRPVTFRKADGKWRLLVSDYGGAMPANVGKQTSLVRTMAEAMATSADEINAGTYPTADAAVDAIQQKLHAAMISFTRPATTRAATQPAPK